MLAMAGGTLALTHSASSTSASCRSHADTQAADSDLGSRIISCCAFWTSQMWAVRHEAACESVSAVTSCACTSRKRTFPFIPVHERRSRTSFHGSVWRLHVHPLPQLPALWSVPEVPRLHFALSSAPEVPGASSIGRVLAPDRGSRGHCDPNGLSRPSRSYRKASAAVTWTE